MAEWIRRQEAWGGLFALQPAGRRQIGLLGTRGPKVIAAALGESSERIAAVLRHLDPGRQHATRREQELRYIEPDWL